jgi:pimeloyl-ACP methyl ester carboxylesterase
MNSHHKLNDTDYWVYNDNPKLPTIIMVHGLRGTHHGLDLVAKLLDRYRVIVPDLPGFGISKPLNGEHSIKNYVAWLGKFIDDLELDKPPILLGHSFGSVITSNYAMSSPDSISKLILVNPIGSPALKGPRAIMTQLALAYYWLGRKLPEPIAIGILSAKPIIMVTSLALTKTSDKVTRKYIHNQHLTHFSSFANRQVVSEAFKASVQENVRNVAQDISVPTLLIAGELDDITPLSKQHELAELFPNASLKVIKAVGHLTQYETPSEIADAIKKFTS